MNPEEERRLYEKGEELLHETDWVFDIMRLRECKQRSMENRAPKKNGGRNSLGRTASEGRLRRQVNYAE